MTQFADGLVGRQRKKVADFRKMARKKTRAGLSEMLYGEFDVTSDYPLPGAV